MRFHQGSMALMQMRAEWFYAACSLVAFCSHSNASANLKLRFQHKLIRLISMLHALALADLEDVGSAEGSAENLRALQLPLIDVGGIDRDSLLHVKGAECKVELVFQWINELIVENIKNQVLDIAPPILTRAFQELSSGMTRFHEAMVIAKIPFPFPYMQACEVLLLLHWAMTPLMLCRMTLTLGWTFSFAFFSVMFLWCLNAVACELENPFGDDANDINAHDCQEAINRQLLLLLRPGSRCIPRLVHGAILDEHEMVDNSMISFHNAWESLESTTTSGVKCSRTSVNMWQVSSMASLLLNMPDLHADSEDVVRRAIDLRKQVIDPSTSKLNLVRKHAACLAACTSPIAWQSGEKSDKPAESPRPWHSAFSKWNSSQDRQHRCFGRRASGDAEGVRRQVLASAEREPAERTPAPAVAGAMGTVGTMTSESSVSWALEFTGRHTDEGAETRPRSWRPQLCHFFTGEFSSTVGEPDSPEPVAPPLGAVPHPGPAPCHHSVDIPVFPPVIPRMPSEDNFAEPDSSDGRKDAMENVQV